MSSCHTPDPAPRPSCCAPAPENKPSCCGGGASDTASSCCTPSRKIDWILWGSLILVAAGITGHFIGLGPQWWHTFSHGTYEFMSKAWWGLLAGIVAVGVIGRLPQDLVSGLLGKGGSFTGILRATFAGTLLDLCNHGILMVGAQLYRKGASLGQTLAFLVSSPWNSLSLTLILAALIGWKWMLLFIAASMVIGIITGWIADRLVGRGVLPANPNARELPADFRFGPAFREALAKVKPNAANLKAIGRTGLSESRMILRWIFFGVVLAAAIRAFVPEQLFSQYFGPTLLGLALTLIATTVIEVCSEGSSPIAADLLTRAAAREMPSPSSWPVPPPTTPRSWCCAKPPGPGKPPSRCRSSRSPKYCSSPGSSTTDTHESGLFRTFLLRRTPRPPRFPGPFRIRGKAGPVRLSHASGSRLG